jgi:hypothetical protein
VTAGGHFPLDVQLSARLDRLCAHVSREMMTGRGANLTNRARWEAASAQQLPASARRLPWLGRGVAGPGRGWAGAWLGRGVAGPGHGTRNMARPVQGFPAQARPAGRDAVRPAAIRSLHLEVDDAADAE